MTNNFGDKQWIEFRHNQSWCNKLISNEYVNIEKVKWEDTGKNFNIILLSKGEICRMINWAFWTETDKKKHTE
jgi:hypothetical protein